MIEAAGGAVGPARRCFDTLFARAENETPEATRALRTGARRLVVGEGAQLIVKDPTRTRPAARRDVEIVGFATQLDGRTSTQPTTEQQAARCLAPRSRTAGHPIGYSAAMDGDRPGEFRRRGDARCVGKVPVSAAKSYIGHNLALRRDRGVVDDRDDAHMFAHAQLSARSECATRHITGTGETIHRDALKNILRSAESKRRSVPKW